MRKYLKEFMLLFIVLYLFILVVVLYYKNIIHNNCMEPIYNDFNMNGGLNSILTIDSILTSSTITFIAFAHNINNNEDALKNKLYWSSLNLYKPHKKNGRICGTMSPWYWCVLGINFSPIFIIFISIIGTGSEIVTQFLLNNNTTFLIIVPILSIFWTMWTTMATILRFIIFRKYWSTSLLENGQDHNAKISITFIGDSFKAVMNNNKKYLSYDDEYRKLEPIDIIRIASLNEFTYYIYGEENRVIFDEHFIVWLNLPDANSSDTQIMEQYKKEETTMKKWFKWGKK